ncbi:MAG TPA: HEAT repeat domain-containing protein [Phycisphaerae bacterium]|jgi:HEAT repeat protein
MNRPILALLALVAPMALAACGGPVTEAEPLSSPTFDKALTILQLQAHSGDPTVRANCIEALQVSRDPRALEVIEGGLHDSEWVVRFAAAMASGESKLAVVRPVLNTLVTNDPNLSVRVGCIYALRRLGDLSHWSDLGATMESADSQVRANTALVLAMSGDEAGIALLQAHRLDPDVRVRFEITSALARLGDAAAQDVIVSESVNKYADDQWNAMVVCGYLPQNVALSPLLLGLQGVSDGAPGATKPAELPLTLTVRRQLIAARSLAKFRNGSGSTIALDNLKNPDPGLRSLAALALGEMLTSRQAPGLDPILEDADEGVRRAAAAAVINVYARAARNH